ncbi:TetR/AcrR family transcriptional regulator [Peribacillus acanthi]|uniref:TetR/AcrR family transcriptional regulator n=1 Tax=Peribacillus acanthi TaxID=2171554 RepID=UPI000D3E064D|nr:TetR/AcrR family transcriptional regulator [Peribacillus acanthi]
MAPRKAESELTREMIMDAARNLFVHQGFQHVSMRQIAKELNCSHGAIYYHFKNKAEIFYKMVEHDFRQLDAILIEILERKLPSREKLVSIFLGFIEFGLNHQNQYEIMFLIKDEEVKSYVNEAPNTSYERFAHAIFTLCEGKATIRQIWTVFLSLHGFITHYCRSGQSFVDVKELAKIHANFLVKGLLD